MKTNLKKIKNYSTDSNLVLILNNIKDLPKSLINKKEMDYIKQQINNKHEVITLNHFPNWIFILLQKKETDKSKTLEKYRQNGTKIIDQANEKKLKELTLVDLLNHKDEFLAVAEGMALANYQFLKYITKDLEKKINTIKNIDLVSDMISNKDIFELQCIIEGTLAARSLVNEPGIFLTAERFSKEIIDLMSATAAKVEVLNKKKIESLKMGGILAVNKGSVDPPTFTIIDWNPQNAKNKKPYIFVGKGIVFDTGGMNIKTENHMNTMKCDMAGGAAVAGAIYAIAKAELPFHVIGLIPATDNRTDGNALLPDDVITMFDKTTVEIINTDAEGRLILADALAYAKKYDPMLVIDIATLTGSAQKAIGNCGIVGMGTKADKEMFLLDEAGYRVYERIVKFPFWDEYDEELKTPVADLKNQGGKFAGAITAGKFLAHFTDYPYIHLDIAGPAFLDQKDYYRPKGGTGVGVRLFFNFIKQKVK